MSSFDEEDWNRPVMGSGARDTVLERRSLISNDDAVLDRIAFPIILTDALYKGKFYTRGCRGMLEQILLYCDRTVAGTITLRYSPHPGLGPIGEVVFVAPAAPAWVAADVEEMWNYDSLFIWVHAITGDATWGYDAGLPYDGHESGDLGATWEDLAIRPFMRAVYSGETPGDVPISGIINNVPIPYTSSLWREGIAHLAVAGVIYPVLDFHGVGYCDFMEFYTIADPQSDLVQFRIYADEVLAYDFAFVSLNNHGYGPLTPRVSLLQFAANGDCWVLLTRRFEFRRRLRIVALTNGAVPVDVGVTIGPTVLT